MFNFCGNRFAKSENLARYLRKIQEGMIIDGSNDQLSDDIRAFIPSIDNFELFLKDVSFLVSFQIESPSREYHVVHESRRDPEDYTLSDLTGIYLRSNFILKQSRCPLIVEAGILPHWGSDREFGYRAGIQVVVNRDCLPVFNHTVPISCRGFQALPSKYRIVNFGSDIEKLIEGLEGF